MNSSDTPTTGAERRSSRESAQQHRGSNPGRPTCGGHAGPPSRSRRRRPRFLPGRRQLRGRDHQQLLPADPQRVRPGLRRPRSAQRVEQVRPDDLRTAVGVRRRQVRPQAGAVHRHRRLGPVHHRRRLRTELSHAGHPVRDQRDRHGGLRADHQRTAAGPVPQQRARQGVRAGAGHRHRPGHRHRTADRPVRAQPGRLALGDVVDGRGVGAVRPADLALGAEAGAEDGLDRRRRRGGRVPAAGTPSSCSRSRPSH